MPDLKVAIVTGASSGVGRATAIRLYNQGYHVVLTARTVSRLIETEKLLGDRSRGDNKSLIVPADLADPTAGSLIIAQTLEQFGRIDVLANVAGYAPRLPINQIEPDILRQCINVNLSGPVLLTAAAWPTLCEQQGGLIINVSSLASLDPIDCFNIYATSKAGLNMFTHCTAQEGAEVGIRAVCIAPGAIETPMLRKLFDTESISKDQTLNPDQVAEFIEDCVMGTRHFDSGKTITLPSP